MYKTENSFEQRRAESTRIRAKYPDRIPVIVEKGKTTNDIPNIDKRKFLVPCHITTANMQSVIRSRLKLDSDKAIFIFINNTLPNHTALVSELYNEYADEDGFLYVTYTGESSFGA